jgi:hypothetical protein
MRAGNGRASHCSSVSRPGKLRWPVALRFMVLRPLSPPGSCPPLFVTTGLDPVVHAEWPRPMSVLRSSMDRRAFARRSNPNSSCAEGFGPRRRVKPGDDESFRSRDAPSHPSFAQAKKSQAKKRRQKIPPLKEGRRSADRRVQEPHRNGMRRASFLLPPCGGPRPRGPHGAGALAFRRPTAASEVF